MKAHKTKNHEHSAQQTNLIANYQMSEDGSIPEKPFTSSDRAKDHDKL